MGGVGTSIPTSTAVFASYTTVKKTQCQTQARVNTAHALVPDSTPVAHFRHLASCDLSPFPGKWLSPPHLPRLLSQPSAARREGATPDGRRRADAARLGTRPTSGEAHCRAGSVHAHRRNQLQPSQGSQRPPLTPHLLWPAQHSLRPAGLANGEVEGVGHTGAGGRPLKTKLREQSWRDTGSQSTTYLPGTRGTAARHL